jgi:hypothetical protein
MGYVEMFAMFKAVENNFTNFPLANENTNSYTVVHQFGN